MNEQEFPSESGLFLIHQALFFSPPLLVGIIIQAAYSDIPSRTTLQTTPVSAVSQHAERFKHVTEILSRLGAVRLWPASNTG